MEKQTVYAIITMTFLLIVGISATLYQQSITGQVIESQIEYDYSFTKAVCGEKYCQDYEIICKNKIPIKIAPITGLVEHSLDWEDPRTQKQINKICD